MHNIVNTGVPASNFKTSAAALSAAGLFATLKGSGPFQVFAPADDALAKIPKADLDMLRANKTKLKSVLMYHVVSGKTRPGICIGRTT